MQNPKEYGINENEISLIPSEIEVAHGSQKTQEKNQEEAIESIRSVRPTNAVSPKKFSKIAKELKSRGFIDYRGKTIKNTHELAELATVFRHPKVEQFQVIYLKDNKIVAHKEYKKRTPYFIMVCK